MERKLNNKLQLWCKTFKDEIISKIQEICLNDNEPSSKDEQHKQIMGLIQMIYDYENIKINTTHTQKTCKKYNHYMKDVMLLEQIQNNVLEKKKRK